MLGTGPFAVPTLQALAASRHEIALVVTRPPTGRNPQASPLQRAGEQLNLELWSPETVNAPAAQSRLTSLNADLLVVCDYGEILKPVTPPPPASAASISTAPLPQFPACRACSMGDPQRRIRNRQQRHPNDPRGDAGPCLAEQRTPINPDEDAAELKYPPRRSRCRGRPPSHRRIRNGSCSRHPPR